MYLVLVVVACLTRALIDSVVALVVLYGKSPHNGAQIGPSFSRNTSRIYMSVRRDRSCQKGIARVLVLLVVTCLRVTGLSLSQSCVACGAYYTGDKGRKAVPCSWLKA